MYRQQHEVHVCTDNNMRYIYVCPTPFYTMHNTVQYFIESFLPSLSLPLPPLTRRVLSQSGTLFVRRKTGGFTQQLSQGSLPPSLSPDTYNTCKVKGKVGTDPAN